VSEGAYGTRKLHHEPDTIEPCRSFSFDPHLIGI
jgi:hypothetical protein